MGNCLPVPTEGGPSLSSQPTSAWNYTSLSGGTDVSSRDDFYSTSSLIRANSGRTESDILSSPHLKEFTYAELENATRNFRSDNVIGRGGFGNVYKGWIDEQTLVAARPGHGMVVAVKKLKPESFQGHNEWLTEVNHLGQLRHQNLVKLIGYCSENENRLLVYEYLSKGSLEDNLFGSGAHSLPWAIRIKVAIDTARGLTFLHDSQQPVIFRDLKASNILLDSEFNAKLSDFGFAKAGPTGDESHVSTRVLGTKGYAAPEYVATGRLTTRCDVYSFGVVLLELLSGHRSFEITDSGSEENLVPWVQPYIGDRRKLFRIMDTKLEGRYPQRSAYTVALLAFQCIGEAKFRPRMAEVVSALEQLHTSPSLSSTLDVPGSSSHSEAQEVASPIPKSPFRQSNPPSPADMPHRGSVPLETKPLPSSLVKSPREIQRLETKSPRGVKSSHDLQQLLMKSPRDVKFGEEQLSPETRSPHNEESVPSRMKSPESPEGR